MINRLIKNFTFDKDIRPLLVFSDATKIRLNTEVEGSGKVQLKADVNGFYPLVTDLYFETPFIEPNAVQQWLGFEVIVTEDPTTFLVPDAFTLQYKVRTSAGNMFFDGTDWVAAGAGNWNTEEEINDNLPSLPISAIGDRKIGFVVNLQTSDDTRTPEIFELKLVGLFDIEFFEDLVYDSVIRKLNTDFRSTSVVVFAATGSTSVDLNSVLENKGYNITGIKKVIDLTADPLKLTNLFQSYALGAAKQDGFTFEPGTVTYSSAIPENNYVEVTFEYVPEIVIKTGVDYFESPAFPSLVFESIEETAIRGFKIKDTNSRERDYIRNKRNLTAILELSPEQRDYRFNYSVWTGSQLDQMRLSEDMKRFFAVNKVVKSWGLDRDYDLNITAEFRTIGNQKWNTVTDANVAEGSFDVLGVEFFQRTSEDVPLVGPGQVNFDIEPQ